MRDAETYIWSEDDQPLADRWRLVTDGHASGWAEVLGRRSESWRRRMVRLSAVWGTAQNARATKLHQRPSVGSQLLFAVSWARAFGHIRSYRRQVLPATLAPIWLTRLRFAHDSQWAQKAPILEAARDRLVLRGHLPQTLGATGIGRASVVVRSQGGRRIRSDGPCAVAVGQHWETADGGRIGWDELRVNHLGRYPIPLPHDLKRGDEVSVDVPLYAPVEPGAYRLTVVAEQTGRRLDSVGVSTALTAEVVVR